MCIRPIHSEYGLLSLCFLNFCSPAFFHSALFLLNFNHQKILRATPYFLNYVRGFYHYFIISTLRDIGIDIQCFLNICSPTFFHLKDYI